MPRTHGYSKKGERCYGTHNWGAKGRTNAIGALIDRRLITVGLFDQSVNTQVFTCRVQQDLIPKLPPKSVIVMDNASFHKGVDMKKSIEDSGHELLYLPTYSPDLNPIEKKWAHAKKLRKSLQCSIDSLFKFYLH
jgi:transposase